MKKTIFIIHLVCICRLIFGAPIDGEKELSGMTLHVIPQSHIDLAWWWRYDPHTIHTVVKHTLETAFANMEKYPDYTFTFLQVPSIAPLEQLYPDLFYKIRYYIHNDAAMGERIPNPMAGNVYGRFAVGSAVYCEFDGAVPCGESLVRQCLYGKRYFLRQFGIDVKTAWFQDAWTHPWTLPQILKKSGIDSYMFTRPRPEEKFMLVPDSLKAEFLASVTKEQNERLFWWEAPDGSRVLAYKPLRIGGENLPDQAVINDYLLELRRKYGVHDGLTLIGVGNHGGGALAADVERMRQTMSARNSGGDHAEIRFSTPQQFVAKILSSSPQLPVIKDELVPTIRGVYTTQGEIKKGNRRSETILLTLEKAAAVTAALGMRPYPRRLLAEAWEKVMLNQFHDTISGTDILPSIEDALRRFREVEQEGIEELQQALISLAECIDTRGRGVPVVVFNPLSWNRCEPVCIQLNSHREITSLTIVDDQNKPLPVQITEMGKKGRSFTAKVLFPAAVPSLGYAVFWAQFQKASPAQTELRSQAFQMENEFFSVAIDSVTGCLASVVDKRNGRQVLAPGSLGNMIQIIEDFGDSEGFLISPKGFGEFNFWTGQTWSMNEKAEIRQIENGPVRLGFEIKKTFGLARFTQRIYLVSRLPRIDFELIIDWQGKNKMVKAAFPLSVQSDSAVYEIPYGTIARPSIGEEHAAQKWVDVSDGHYGVSLLNDGRYGCDVTANTIRLSLLRSPDQPVAATEEAGTHRIGYSLYPHEGNWKQARTMQKGYEFNFPLIAVATDPHHGLLPARHSFFAVEPANVLIEVLKKAEDSEDLLLRLFETEGSSGIVRLTLSPFLRVDAVHKADLMENELETVDLCRHAFNFEISGYAIETFKLIADE